MSFMNECITGTWLGRTSIIVKLGRRNITQCSRLLGEGTVLRWGGRVGIVKINFHTEYHGLQSTGGAGFWSIKWV